MGSKGRDEWKIPRGGKRHPNGLRKPIAEKEMDNGLNAITSKRAETKIKLKKRELIEPIPNKDPLMGSKLD